MTSPSRLAAIALTLAAALLVTALGLLVGPRALGWELQMVLSGSMAPTFDVGSVVAIRPLPAGSVEAGDVITFRQADGPPLTHRVLEVQGSGAAVQFVTKGDANEFIDPSMMAATAVLGEVVADVPYLGYLASFMRQPLGFLLFIMMPGIAFMLAEMRSIVRTRSVQSSDAVAT